jgi:hypothetical protein
MAKKPKIAPIKPQRSHGYGAILFFTLLAMSGGIGLLVWELNDSYGFELEAKKFTPPKIAPREPMPPLQPKT